MQILKRLKRLWRLSGETDIVVIKEGSMDRQSVIDLAKMTGKTVVVSKSVDDVRVISSSLDPKGDGKAEFFGEPSEKEEIEFEKEEHGIKDLFKDKEDKV